MGKDVFSYLDKDYKYLNKYIEEVNKLLFNSPHSAIIKGRTFAEQLAQQISNLEKYGYLYDMTQAERLRFLENQGVIEGKIADMFHRVRKLGNEAAHSSIEGELEAALNIHKNIYKITCWFVQSYIDYTFEPEEYKNPVPDSNGSLSINEEVITELMGKLDKLDKLGNLFGDKEADGNNKSINPEVSNREKEMAEEVLVDLELESILDNKFDKKCLVQELSRLKESSKEAVEGLGQFTPFKKYMHIERDAQRELEELILRASKSERSQLILICGSVGDGKSHIISYFKNKYPEIMKNFTLHNDATESLEPDKTSMDTLDMVLGNFSDERVQESNEKIILAINLGTLNNFIDSKYGEKFSNLKKFVYDKKILETGIEDNSFDENSSFQFVDFSDYHIFTLKDGEVNSSYIKSLINKITDSSELNIFYKIYKKHCSECGNCTCCPIKANYEILGNEKLQNALIDLLVQCIIKNKIIISTRALINFMYDLIVPRTYIDVNSPMFKEDISKLNYLQYIRSLMPYLMFSHKELSFIFESLYDLDPLNVRNLEVDDFILEFNNSKEILSYFKQYIDYSKGYLDKVSEINFQETVDKDIRHELLKLFIRSYYLCGKGEIFSLNDEIYENYIEGLYFWNRGDKPKLKKLYDNMRNGIVKWNGEAEKDQINIFIGKNQTKYKISEDIDLKADTSNLPKSEETELIKFITTLKLGYKSDRSGKTYELDIDFTLYRLLMQVVNGYRLNRKDKNKFINFVEFINKLEESGAQSDKLIITEKNREINKKYKLEYDNEFEFYRFVEI